MSCWATVDVVHSTYRSLYDELGRMRQAIADSTGLNDASKLEASVSIETIKDQLALAQPDRTIVEKAAWQTASRSARLRASSTT